MPTIIDVSQVVDQARRLAASATEVTTAVRPVISRAGMNMKRQGAAEAQGVQGGRISAAWGYDVKDGGLAVEAGPAEGGAGSLAFFYFGNSKIGPRLPDPVGLLNQEAARTVPFLVEAAVRAMR